MRLQDLVLTMWNEIYFYINMTIHYKLNTFMRLAAMFLKFIGYSFFIFNGAIDPAGLPSPFLGYTVWFYAFFILLDMSWGLREEMQEGTIEQLFMGTTPPHIIFASRILACIIVTTIKLLIILGVLMALLPIPLTFNLAGLCALTLTLASISGLGITIAGLTLVMKRTETIGVFFANMFLFLSGTIIPIDKLPKMVQYIAMAFPTTQGIIVLRNTVLHGQTLSSTWHDGSLLILLATTAVYVISGAVIFSLCVHHVKSRGSLSQY